MSQLAYVLIMTAYGKKKDVSRKLLEFDEIKDIHEVYGQYDIIIQIKTENINTLEDFIQNNIRSIREIQKTETLVVSDIP